MSLGGADVDRYRNDFAPEAHRRLQDALGEQADRADRNETIACGSAPGIGLAGNRPSPSSSPTRR
jgi:hypothetical protein